MSDMGNEIGKTILRGFIIITIIVAIIFTAIGFLLKAKGIL